MNRCKQCNINVRDDVQICPLCKCALEIGEGTENKYPDIAAKRQRVKLLLRIYLFVAILVGCTLVVLNLLFTPDFIWSVIPVCALAYVYLTLAYMAGYDKSGYRTKIIVGVFAAVALLILIDGVTGYKAWSGNYVLPGLTIALDIAIMFLVFINRKNWQSYLPIQLIMIPLSLIPFVLYFFGLVTSLTVSYISLSVSVFFFLGTYIIGGERAWEELRRRFHI